jgi:GT2 family glycosyltransferase
MNPSVTTKAFSASAVKSTSSDTVLINWNSISEQLAAKIREVDKRLSQASLDCSLTLICICLWDNNSSNFVEPSIEVQANLTITRCAKNLGFAARSNHALEKLQGFDWVLLVNLGAMSQAEVISLALNAAEVFPDLSLSGFSLPAVERVGVLDSLGDVVHASGLCWRDAFNQPCFGIQGLNEPYESFAICAAALLIRRDLFEAVGGFDEDFFFYQEDVDLGFRLRLMGYRALKMPNAVVYHVSSRSTSGYRSYFSIYHGWQNLVRCDVRNTLGLLFSRLLLLHFALNTIELLCFIYQAQGRVPGALSGMPLNACPRCAVSAKRLRLRAWRQCGKFGRR